MSRVYDLGVRTYLELNRDSVRNRLPGHSGYLIRGRVCVFPNMATTITIHMIYCYNNSTNQSFSSFQETRCPDMRDDLRRVRVGGLQGCLANGNTLSPRVLL